jgi:hypothetical protein
MDNLYIKILNLFIVKIIFNPLINFYHNQKSSLTIYTMHLSIYYHQYIYMNISQLFF